MNATEATPRNGGSGSRLHDEIDTLIGPAVIAPPQLSASDEFLLAGHGINSPRGRFTTPRHRAQALFLNEGGWHSCKNQHWHDQEPGEPCMECGEPMRKERQPDRGSVFAQVYERYVAYRKAGGEQ